MQLRRYGIKYQRINHIFISHLHGDHYFGLVGLLSTMHLMGRTKPIHIYGPVGLKNIVELQLHAGGSRLAFDFLFHELEEGTSDVILEDDKFFVKNFPLRHKIATHGYLVGQKAREHTLIAEKANADGVKVEYFHRLKRGENIIDETGNEIRFEDYTKPAEAPKTYAFCSDTAYHEPIKEVIEGVDVLYHEATFMEDLRDRANATRHSTAKDAAKMAEVVQAGRLLMGHLSARYENADGHEAEAREIFENAEFVQDGETYTINEIT